MRQVFGRGFFVGGALASAMTISKGRVELGKLPAEPDADQPLLVTDRDESYPGARRQAHVRQALVGLRLRQQDARRPAEPHPHRAPRAARGRASCGRTCARRRCTRSAQADDDGTVLVELAPSNCVQCGAITAKGGRLTPPEGGSGPEYTAS